MRGLAAFVMRGRVQAITATAALGLLSLAVLPTLLLTPLSWPLSFLSAATVALVVLAQGLREGLLNAAGATLLVALAGALLMGGPEIGLGLALTLWLPAWLLAAVLRQTRSLAMALLTAGALGCGAVLVIYAVLGDPAAWWIKYFDEALLPVLREQGGVDAAELEQLQVMLHQAARFVTGMTGAGLALAMGVSLLIARWWQAVLYRPGAFGEEFRALRLGLIAALVPLALAAAVLVSDGLVHAALVDLLTVLLVLFMFQGLAVAHTAVARLGAGKGWLGAMYVLLGLSLFGMTLGLMLVAAVGLVDNWLNLRARLPGARGQTGTGSDDGP